MTTALITGANRGLGREFARQLRDRGARVYATARDPERIDLPGVEKLRLDITDPASIEAAARVTGDVTLLVNNAGINNWQDLVSGDLAAIRRDVDCHFWGTLSMVRAYAPILATNGGGAILNVLSALSWFAYPGTGSYAAGKAAQWSLTNSIRLELAGQGTQVTGVHLGAADTDMSAAYDGPKVPPADVVTAALDGLAAGKAEVIADDWSAHIKASLAGDPLDFYQLAQPSASNR